MCHAVHQYEHWIVSNFCGRAMSQKLSINDFKWVEDISIFHKTFIKSYNEESDEEYFLEVDIQCLENLHNFHKALPFLPERMKIKNVEKLVANLHNKT